MKPVSALSLLLLPFLASSCFIYSDSLVGEGSGAGGAGTGSGSGSTPGGGSGGVGGGGGTGSVGGGGTPSGGGSDGGTGSGTSGGGTGSDGGGGSDGGSGGGTTEDDLITDFTTVTFLNPPFAGGFDRYAEPGATWTAVAKADMRQERDDEPGNHALHVQVTTLDDWGAGVYITLNQPGGSGAVNPLDISEYTGIKFTAKKVGTEGNLVVALEDAESRPDPLTIEHAKSAAPTTIDTTWQTFTLPFTTFLRTPELDETIVYAIHFTMDPAPSATELDFWIDDIYAYKE